MLGRRDSLDLRFSLPSRWTRNPPAPTGDLWFRLCLTTTYGRQATRAPAAPKTVTGLGLRHWTLATGTWSLASEARPVLAKIRKDVFDINEPTS
jgi:hypothetical protein